MMIFEASNAAGIIHHRRGFDGGGPLYLHPVLSGGTRSHRLNYKKAQKDPFISENHVQKL